VVCLLIQRSRAGWSGICHGGSFHFDGEIDDEVALG
jgi:hypothetical protein